jgi:hypothetical protein
MIRKQLAPITLVLCLLASVCSGQQTEDPYRILQANLDAIGGTDRVDAIRTEYAEMRLTTLPDGGQGQIIEWSETGGRRFWEMTMPSIHMLMGHNGEYRWTWQNGQLDIESDSAQLAKRLVDSLLDAREHHIERSKYFEVSYLGLDTANGRDCHAIQILNSINDDIRVQFFDCDDYLLRKAVLKEPNMVSTFEYSDFREIGGVMYPFRLEHHDNQIDYTLVFETELLEVNIPIADSLFEPPTTDSSVATGNSSD